MAAAMPPQFHLGWASDVPERHLLVAMVKAWANAWCTARRMGSAQPCPFCNLEAGSDILHFASCSGLVDSIKAVLPGCQARWLTNSTMNNFLGIRTNNDQFLVQALLVDLVGSVFDDIRHHGHGPVQLALRGRVRQAHRRWPQYLSTVMRALP